VGGFVVWYFLLFFVSDITPPYLDTWAFYAKNYKILYNVLPFAMLTAGLAGERLAADWKPGRWVVYGVVGVLCVGGFASGACEMADGSFSIGSRYPSHNQAFMGRAYAKRDDLGSAAERCQRHGPRDRPDCLEGVGTRAIERAARAAPCASFAPEDRPFCYRGVGWELNWYGRLVQPERIAKICGVLEPFSGECMRGYMEITPDAIYNMPTGWLRRFLDERSESDRALLGRGFGVFLATRFHADAEFVFERCERIESSLELPGCSAAAARELGSLAGRTWPEEGVSAPEGYESEWSRGLGEMLAWRHHEEPERADSACDELVMGVPSACRSGLEYWRGLMDPAVGAPLLPENVTR
jgi:hypothetical protein